MFQKFFTNTIESKFIQALLYNTPLPIIPTVREGDYVVKNNTYIYGQMIIKCTTSGYLLNDSQPAAYSYIGTYDFGEYHPKLTEKFIPRYSYYDTESHTVLGNYLRCLRDIRNLDLMRFYNCFAGNYRSDILLNTQGFVRADNTQFKVIEIPIKFNKTYTIAITCTQKVIVLPFIDKNNNMIQVLYDGEPTDINKILNCKSTLYTNLSFEHPITFRVDNMDDSESSSAELLARHEKFLKLLIQVPRDNVSNIMILEGDYSRVNSSTDRIMNIEYMDEWSIDQLEHYFSTDLSLLRINDNNRWAFNDMLIAYLLGNVISNEDTISQNIEITRAYLLKYLKKNDIEINDKKLSDVTWTLLMRYYIFNIMKKTDEVNVTDLLGYVDKNVEKFLFKDGD